MYVWRPCPAWPNCNGHGGLMFPPEETAAAQRRVRVKRAQRRLASILANKMRLRRALP